MKRSILFLAAVVFPATALSGIVGIENNTEFNEIKNTIYYTPTDGWTISAYIGTTFIDDCGPTNSSGVCGILGLSAGTYNLIAERNDCSAIYYNVYHPGTGVTTVYFGPTTPEVNCAK